MRNVDALVQPATNVTTGLPQNPLTNAFDQTRLFCKGDELNWRNSTPFRMLPAKQRLHAADLPGLQVCQRLIHQLQLFQANGVAQGLSHVVSCQHLLVHRIAIELEGVSTARLRAVHGNFHRFEQGMKVIAILGKTGDANGGGQRKFMPLQLIGLRQLQKQPAREMCGST